jgi:hypothetical protein
MRRWVLFACMLTAGCGGQEAAVPKPAVEVVDKAAAEAAVFEEEAALATLKAARGEALDSLRKLIEETAMEHDLVVKEIADRSKELRELKSSAPGDDSQKRMDEIAFRTGNITGLEAIAKERAEKIADFKDHQAATTERYATAISVQEQKLQTARARRDAQRARR